MTNYKSKFHQILASFVVTLGAFALGSVLGWNSPALPSLLGEPNGHFVNISRSEQSWICSSATLGALASCPIAGLSIEKFGRKRTMMHYAIPLTLGWILIGYSYNVFCMCTGRFISGFCGGIFSLSAPVYIGEIAESSIRGMLINSFQLMLVLGILFTYTLGTFVSWKTLALISSWIPLIFLAFSTLIPESPRYLMAQDKFKESKKALCWLRGTDAEIKVVEELSQLEASVLEDREKKSAKFRDLLKKNVLKPLLICMTLMMLRQASAVNVVIFYCEEIFAEAGSSSSVDSYLASIIVAVVQVVATIVSAFLVDSVGRRVLLLFSEAMIGTSFSALGAFFYLKYKNDGEIMVPEVLGWLPLVSVILFVVAFSIGIGPLSWTIMGEMLHPNVKGLCSAIAVSFVWFCAFVVTRIYRSVEIHLAFWIFSSVSIIGTFIVYFLVPETKGKTLDEIQLIFNPTNVKSPNETGREAKVGGLKLAVQMKV